MNITPGLRAKRTTARTAAVAIVSGDVNAWRRRRDVTAAAGPVDAALVDVARDAFLRGLVLCAAIGGVGSLALAILADWTFRGASVLPQRTAEHHAQVVA